MYTLCIRRDFIARHFLIGGDWGAENFPNSHHYVLELELRGQKLDQHGYLCDIVEVEKHLEEVIARYREQLLNDLPEFAGLNPSLEHFARLLAEQCDARLAHLPLTGLTVRLWENEWAWASFTLERRT